LKTNYIFIDFENVQPKDLALLNGRNFKLMIFVGATQTKLPTEMVCAVQSLGTTAEYVRIDGSGRNALDFHIAYHLGRAVVAAPDGEFAVISNDTGFDPLMKHLKTAGICCGRFSSLSDLPPAFKPPAKPTIPTSASELPSKATGSKPLPARAAAAKPAGPAPTLTPVQKVLANLDKRGSAKPRTLKALTSSIQNVLGKQADGSAPHVVAELERLGAIKRTGETVAYPNM
jgi:hypothetical protein